jgi:hypothetical protein
MSKCDLCGKEASLLRKRHNECEARHTAGVAQVASLARDAALDRLSAEELRSQVAELAPASFIADQVDRPR